MANGWFGSREWRELTVIVHIVSESDASNYALPRALLEAIVATCVVASHCCGCPMWGVKGLRERVAFCTFAIVCENPRNHEESTGPLGRY
jgi:hypothetical protein